MEYVQATTRAQFIQAYEYSVEPEHDFEQDGAPAEWAPGHPKEWGSETDSFNISGKPETGLLQGAMSGDAKLLAISSRDDHIMIYDIGTKELRQELDGSGHVFFRPLPRSQGADADEADGAVGEPAYILISSVANVAERGVRRKNQMVLWELDKHGRLLVEEEHLDTVAFAGKAVESILPELEAKHEWTRDFVNASNLHADIEKALAKVAVEHRRRHNTTLDDASPGSFRQEPFSSDGKKLLYHYKNTSTQSGMRPPEELPQVVVWDVDEGKELMRLRGHTDAIMWSGFSPDGHHIASISWDGTMRMYDGVKGDLQWVTENCNRQCWSGAFSPDSKHIVWSSNSGKTIRVHDVADGSILATFRENFTDWSRHMAWHPEGHQIALYVNRRVFVWEPFTAPDGKRVQDGSTVQTFILKGDDKWRSFVSVSSVEWIEDGRKLVVSSSDGTNLVWDAHNNCKELFKRPKDTPAGVSNGFYHVHTGLYAGFYVSIDGDAKVRYWRANIPASPSWWEKSESERAALEATQQDEQMKVYPETGKYVNITRKPKGRNSQDGARDAWAEKGAGIWTAE